LVGSDICKASEVLAVTDYVAIPEINLK